MTEARSGRKASHPDAAPRMDQATGADDELRDPRVRALARRLSRLAPWPVSSEWLARTKEELLNQLDRASERRPN